MSFYLSDNVNNILKDTSFNDNTTINNVSLTNLTANDTLTCNNINITGGIFNSSQKPTWYMYSATPGSGITADGGKFGASTNTGAYFSDVSVSGNASSSSWNKSTGLFTAPANGTYSIQMNIFNNSANTITYGNRWLVITPWYGVYPFWGQYCDFENYSSTEESHKWNTIFYLNQGNQFGFTNLGGVNISLYYGVGYTNLTITKII